MNLAYFVLYFSILVWTFVPIRQYGQKLFWFFLFLAMQDPLTLILRKIFHSTSNIIYIIASVFMLFSLYETNYKQRKMILFVITLVIWITLYQNKVPNMDFYLDILGDTIILAAIFKKTVNHLIVYKEIKTFFAILILYQLSNITKVLHLFTGVLDAYFYFYLTTVFEILIGLFFIIFKEDDLRITIKIRK